MTKRVTVGELLAFLSFLEWATRKPYEPRAHSSTERWFVATGSAV